MNATRPGRSSHQHTHHVGLQPTTHASGASSTRVGASGGIEQSGSLVQASPISQPFLTSADGLRRAKGATTANVSLNACGLALTTTFSLFPNIVKAAAPPSLSAAAAPRGAVTNPIPGHSGSTSAQACSAWWPCPRTCTTRARRRRSR